MDKVVDFISEMDVRKGKKIELFFDSKVSKSAIQSPLNQ